MYGFLLYDFNILLFYLLYCNLFIQLKWLVSTEEQAKELYYKKKSEKETTNSFVSLWRLMFV